MVARGEQALRRHPFLAVVRFMARVLVTGGAGFIGSHTVERLLKDGHAVVVVDNLSSGTWANLAATGGAAECVELDVRDAPALTALVRSTGVAAIIHLAAWASVSASLAQPPEAHAINVVGTLNVLEAARLAGVRRVVLASSTAVYGAAPPIPTSEDCPLQPASPYAAHKAAAEMLCTAYRAAFGLETVILRYFNVYGRRQPADSPYGGVVANFAHNLAVGRPVRVDGDGSQTRDFIHVSDVAAITARAAVGPDPGEGAINVGSGRQTSIIELLEAMQLVLGRTGTITSSPTRPGDVSRSQADIRRLRARLQYQPRVDLRTGLEDLLASCQPQEREAVEHLTARPSPA